MSKFFWSALLSLFWVSQAMAGDIAITDAWARATAPEQDSATVSMHIISRKDASLVAVSSPVADHVEIHTMSHDEGMMIMREIETLDLPANQEVVLGGEGYHLMLMGLKQQLKAGTVVPLTLTFQSGAQHKESLHIKATVRSLTSTGEHGGHMHHPD